MFLTLFLSQGLDGKVAFAFDNVDALRIFSKTLLHHYFGINLEIPENCLVPTIPLRLNYILWLQDLAQSMSITDNDVYVIDIGAGATCIYGLLMHKIRNWKVLALESNENNLKAAENNIQLNRMQDFIHGKI